MAEAPAGWTATKVSKTELGVGVLLRDARGAEATFTYTGRLDDNDASLAVECRARIARILQDRARAAVVAAASLGPVDLTLEQQLPAGTRE